MPGKPGGRGQGMGHGMGHGGGDSPMGGGFGQDRGGAADPTMLHRGRSEDSPGHRKQDARAQSARDYAPGRLGRSDDPSSQGGDDGDRDEAPTTR